MFDLEYVRRIALVRPRLAYCLMRFRKVPSTMSLKVAFTSTNQGETISDSLAPFGAPPGRRRVGCDFIVNKLPRYTVRRPNYLFGSIDKAQSDVNNCIIPYVDVRFVLEGCVDLLLNSEFAAIETVLESAPVTSVECDPWVIPALSSVFGEFRLAKRLAAEEVPYLVEVAFRGYVLTGCMNQAADIGDDEVLDTLHRRLNIPRAALLSGLGDLELAPEKNG